MESIDFASLPTCYAITWSYGEICVKCNCCGRIEKGLEMWESRLDYHKTELYRQMNFNEWAVGYPDLIKNQKEVNQQNIKHHRAKMKYCVRKILKIKEKLFLVGL